MKKLCLAMIFVMIIGMTSAFAATKAEIEEQWDALVQEEAKNKERLDAIIQEYEQILEQMNQYDIVSFGFLDSGEVVKDKPLVVKQNKLFSMNPNYFLIKNPVVDSEFKSIYLALGGIYFGKHSRLGYTQTVNIGGWYYEAEVLGDLPAEYSRLDERRRKLDKEFETLDNRNSAIEREKDIVQTAYQNAGKEPSDWAKEEVKQAMAKGLIPNELENDYQEYITRQEFCKLIVELLTRHYNMEIDEMLKQDGMDYPSTSPFSDTVDKEVIVTSLYGIMGGIGNGKFNPNGYISREMAATILTRLIHSQGITKNNGRINQFADYEQASPWAKDSIKYISGCMGQGSFIMSGSNGNFRPKEYYTREQAYISIYRLLGFLQNKENLKEENPAPQLLDFLGKDYVAKNKTHDVITCLYYKKGNYYLDLQGVKIGTAFVCLSARSEALQIKGNTLKGKYRDTYGNEGEVTIEYLSEDNVKLNISVNKVNHKITMQIENQDAIFEGYSELVSQEQFLDDDDSNDYPCE